MLKFNSSEQDLLKLGSVELKVENKKLLLKYNNKGNKKIFPIKIEKILGTQMFFQNNGSLKFLGKSRINLILKENLFYHKKYNRDKLRKYRNFFFEENFL